MHDSLSEEEAVLDDLQTGLGTCQRFERSCILFSFLLVFLGFNSLFPRARPSFIFPVVNVKFLCDIL